MTSRQRLQATFARQIPDRVAMVDISFWPETIERWQKEGLLPGTDPTHVLGMDRIERFSFNGSLNLPGEIVEENERWRIRRDANGLLIKEWRDWRVSYSPPVRLDCLVKSWDDWVKVKERLQFDPQRVSAWQMQAYRAWRDADLFVAVNPGEPMWYLIEELMGYSVGLPLLVEQPDLAADILNTYTDFILGMCQWCVEQGIVFDGLWFFSDLCYKNGMLFSPRTYRDLLMPCHQRVKAWCESQSISLILHCDGDVREFIPLLVEVGFDAIQPLEARCGNDVRDLKPRYGTGIVFFGNIGADVMAYGTDAEVEAEVATKVTAAKEGGGYLYHSDHSIPPTVSFERYRTVIELVRRYGGYET